VWHVRHWQAIRSTHAAQLVAGQVPNTVGLQGCDGRSLLPRFSPRKNGAIWLMSSSSTLGGVNLASFKRLLKTELHDRAKHRWSVTHLRFFTRECQRASTTCNDDDDNDDDSNNNNNNKRKKKKTKNKNENQLLQLILAYLYEWWPAVGRTARFSMCVFHTKLWMVLRRSVTCNKRRYTKLWETKWALTDSINPLTYLFLFVSRTQ